MNRTFFVCGWGIVPESAGTLLGRNVVALPPTRAGIAALASTLAPEDVVCGYSLGAWLLLEAAATGTLSHEKVTLYAPFLAFTREKGRGGKVAGTQIKFLSRRIKTDWRAGVSDFYARAGLTFALDAQPDTLENLQTGLEILLTGTLENVPELAKTWQIVLGAQDALLDASTVTSTFPITPKTIFPAGTHDLKTLLHNHKLSGKHLPAA